MRELQAYLQSYFGADEEDIEKLISYFHPATLPKGGYFLKAGRVCDKFSFQRSGLLRVYASHGEKEVTQWISYRGNFITDLAGMIYNEPSRYNIQALTTCEFYTINKNDYNNLSKQMDKWAQLERVLITRCYAFLESRIFGLLSMTGEERYQSLFMQSPELFNEVPLKYLASMLGMTPESLSRIRKNTGV